jgi:hypothetical protein
MTSKMPKEQSANDYVLNPYTGRLLKKGSKTHARLISARLMDDEPSGKGEENIILEAESPSQAKEIKTKMNNKSVGKNKTLTTRGNKVLKTTRRPTRTETIDKVTDYAVDSVIAHREEIMNAEMTEQEMENYIKVLIAKKLVGGKEPKRKRKPKPVPLPPPPSESDESEEDVGYDSDE